MNNSLKRLEKNGAGMVKGGESIEPLYLMLSPVNLVILFTFITYSIAKYLPSLFSHINSNGGKYAALSAAIGYLSLIISRVEIKNKLAGRALGVLFFSLYLTGLIFASFFTTSFLIR